MSGLLELRNLNLYLAAEEGPRHILRGINLELRAGGFYGLIGESGCGKTMTARAILGMLDEMRSYLSGEILLDGIRLDELSKKERRSKNGLLVSYVSQDPMTALNPLYTAGEQIAEVLREKMGLKRAEAKAAAISALDSVGLAPAKTLYSHYPHQFSGGQQQRICIAMAVATQPKLLIADEPTTALDVTTQAQILKLLRSLKERGITVLLITHDFGVIFETCEEVFVMQEGAIVEQGTKEEIFKNPKHPATLRLMESARRKAAYGTDRKEAP